MARFKRPGITTQPPVLDRAVIEFELDGARIRFSHTTVYGRRFTTDAPRDAPRMELAATIAMGLHLAAEDAFALADEVMRRIGGTSPA